MTQKIQANTNNNILSNILPNIHSNKPDIKYLFKAAPKIGLENIGATDYMNSTIQCLCHIPALINYFKYSIRQNDKALNIKDNLTSSFKLLIDNLWPDHNNYSKKYYTPNEFKNKISKMNPLFEGIQANDAKDLLYFIITTLHEELNKAKKEYSNNIENLDRRNKSEMFNYYSNNFMKNNISIISDLFYGTICSISQCGNCNVQSYDYQAFFELRFPLEEVRKFKNNKDKCINEVSLYDCFDYHKKIEFLSGENSMYCSYCKSMSAASYCTTLTILPHILIIILNRGRGKQFNVKCNFTEDLNLNNYCEFKNPPSNYKLIGVITHLGPRDMSGHFIAYCLDPIIKKWHRYNDSIVTDVSDFRKEIVDSGSPYILFYQKL